MNMKITMFSIISISLLTAAGCTNLSLSNERNINIRRMLKEVNRIAVVNPVISSQLPGAASIAEQYEQLVLRKLKDTGIEFVPSLEYRQLVNQAQKEAGELFDPKTGAPHKDKLAAVYMKAERQLREKHSYQAIAIMGVKPVTASWRHSTASWDGKSEHICGAGNFWVSMNTPQGYGSVAALSFFFTIKGTNNFQYYTGMGGIQLRSHYKGNEFVKVPYEHLLTNRTDIVQSVDLALDPLITHCAEIQAEGIPQSGNLQKKP